MTTSPEPTFRSIEPRDEPTVAALLNAAFEGAWPAYPIRVPALDHLRWRLQSPGAVPGAATVLELDGRIVAFDGSIGHRVWVRGETRTGCIMVDSAVHPDFQGRGLSKQHLHHFLARWADVEQPVSLEEGSNNPRLNASSGTGSVRMRVANTVELLSRPIALRSHVRGVLAHPSLARFVRLARSLRGARSRGGAASSVTVKPTERFDDRADKLWTRARADFDYCVVRDREYLNWRYCDPRAGIYHARIAERGSELVGYSILTTRGLDVTIVDLLVAGGDTDALTVLVEDAIAAARGARARSLTLQLPRIHPYRPALGRAGFSVVATLSNMGHRPRNDSLLDFLSTDPAARLHVAYGDSDHV